MRVKLTAKLKLFTTEEIKIRSIDNFVLHTIQHPFIEYITMERKNNQNML